MIQLVGTILMITSGARFLWVLLFYFLNVSGRSGANISKKVGTDNAKTDEFIADSKKFDGDLKDKLIWRGALLLIGLLLYLFG